MTAELEKLAHLRRLDAHAVDLSMLPAQQRRLLAGVGRRGNPGEVSSPTTAS
ncbi:hypothetical protein [Actinoplanes sp. RD1]|uniref:hypothetical protein n=1 Tax=Actinoplanes sp. RD1 TaxID=3064538 RepID=UPI002740B3A0|nr:hypothetical protein [Actinoplanes sp. RD1]